MKGLHLQRLLPILIDSEAIFALPMMRWGSNWGRIVLSSLLLAFATSGCYLEPLPINVAQIYVENTTQLCVGGLKVQLVYQGDVVYESVTVQPGQVSSEGHGSGPSNGVTGTPLNATIRAFCYGSQGEEVGYAETTTTFFSNEVGRTHVTVVPKDSPDPRDCAPSTTRGQAPCIVV